ncbi:MAG: hypothetical protein C0421_07970 [Hyphomonas sp.]|uniref:alpha/beta hydrolase n=1 Tax=Hyphomonas sp. TaxID=87 RepID=UPI0025C00CEF|nr:alpha/beta hydrolase [Hyphomonas sp.]MBA4338765.1 hypothetical protein [Hyphomonas sp.]
MNTPGDRLSSFAEAAAHLRSVRLILIKSEANGLAQLEPEPAQADLEHAAQLAEIAGLLSECAARLDALPAPSEDGTYRIKLVSRRIQILRETFPEPVVTLMVLQEMKAYLVSAAEAAEPAQLSDIGPAGEGVGTLTQALKNVLAEDDWKDIESKTGAQIPAGIRETPVIITPAGGTGFDGSARIRLTYAPGAPRAVQDAVRSKFLMSWRSAVQAEYGKAAFGTLEPETPAEVPDAHVCEILFATNRAKQAGVHPAFTSQCSADADPLSWGEARVSVPNRRAAGKIQRPWSIAGLSLPANARQHFILEGCELLSKTALIERLRMNETGTGFLFVHGYNTSFDAGLFRTAQIAADLEIDGQVFHYAWPSAGRPWKYDFDADNILASVSPFKRFIKTLIEEGGITQLNVVAHSKGNQLVLNAFADLAKESVELSARHLVLASPDVAEAPARGWLKEASNLFQTVTLYANAHDRPLLLSMAKASGPRMGALMPDGHPFIEPALANFDTIDAGDVDFDYFAFNHDAYVDAPILRYDLEALLKRSLRPPNIRSPVIRQARCSRGPYFRVVSR